MPSYFISHLDKRRTYFLALRWKYGIPKAYSYFVAFNKLVKSTSNLFSCVAILRIIDGTNRNVAYECDNTEGSQEIFSAWLETRPHGTVAGKPYRLILPTSVYSSLLYASFSNLVSQIFYERFNYCLCSLHRAIYEWNFLHQILHGHLEETRKPAMISEFISLRDSHLILLHR